ncbi:MAG TPA: hypothetical protein VH255_09005, partial [Verrucomicrobiae bacterium]|nr:hypothetical protein [Verrucomicrobiae bacterium]
MSRTGKIARMPKGIRDELNQRLQNGEPGSQLVEWLNGRRAVKAVLVEHFEGRAVNEQNLSDWKSGGYVEWERNEEAKELMQQLGEKAGSIAEANVSVEECLATVLGAEMVSLARALMDKEEDPQKRWEQLCQVNKE